MCKVIAYYRVSTEGQGRSGLGLDAQRQAVTALCQSRGWHIMADYTEVESGKSADRKQLIAALHHAKVTGGTLVIAKLDRLSRNAAFIAALQDSGAKFIAADMPEANELTVHIMAAVAQAERQAISKRTREALAAAKMRGVKLGNPNGAAAIRRAARGNSAAVKVISHNAVSFALDLAPIIEQLREEGITSLPQLARKLNEGGFATARGGKWHPSNVKNVCQRIDMIQRKPSCPELGAFR